MGDTRYLGRFKVRQAVVACLGVAAAAAEARADRIVIRGGAPITGKVVPDPRYADRVTILTERGKTPLSFQKAQIVQVIAEPGPLDAYLTRRGETPATAEGQFELGQWCEGRKLLDLADLHYEAALRLDKTFAPAHRKRGHVLYEDRWITRDERREAQGLIRSRGRWITPEEKEQQEKYAANAAEQASWARRIGVLREAIAFSSEGRRHEAEAQLLEIRDPLAVGPLVRVLGRDPAPNRILLAHVLGSIPGPEATSALAVRLLDEGEDEVRFAVIDEILQRNPAEVTRVLLKGLRSNTPEVVNRAAWGLSNLNAVSTVPNLVAALITVRYEVVMAFSGGSSGEGPGGSATFGSVPPSQSGAVVGPNVAAYGAYSLPSYALPDAPALPNSGIGPSSPAGLGISAGGGVMSSRGPVPRMVRVSYRNPQVLAALVKMTGQDFGWDADAWKLWVRTSFNSEPTPARRVPQP